MRCVQASLPFFTSDSKEDFTKFFEDLPRSQTLAAVGHWLSKTDIKVPGSEEQEDAEIEQGDSHSESAKPRDEPAPTPSLEKAIKKEVEEQLEGCGPSINWGLSSLPKWQGPVTSDDFNCIEDTGVFEELLQQVKSHPLFDDFWAHEMAEYPEEEAREFGDENGDADCDLQAWVEYLKQNYPNLLPSSSAGEEPDNEHPAKRIKTGQPDPEQEMDGNGLDSSEPVHQETVIESKMDGNGGPAAVPVPQEVVTENGKMDGNGGPAALSVPVPVPQEVVLLHCH